MKCPKCGAEIGRFELSQNCKNCGVNLFYSQQEELLSTDAKRCELEYASLHLFTARLKAAFIKGPLQILRIVFLLVCLGSLFIPFSTLKVELPLFNHSISFAGYGLYQSFSDGSLKALLSFARIGVVSGVARAALIMIVSIVFLVLVVALILVSELLSFTNIRRSAKCICVLSILGVLGSAASFGIVRFFVSSAAQIKSITVTAGFGYYAAAVAFAAMFVINLLIIKKKIAPQYKEVDLKRVAVHKQVKRGEVSLKDLPLPVFESDEERENRLKEEAKEKELEGAVASNV